LEALAERLAERDALRAAHADAQRAAEVHTARLQEAQHALGALAERLERCRRDRVRLAETAAALKDARRRQTLYTKLRTAFGRSGIPALIIEETLPEIEARANELLAQLSNGRTRVALETLRDKKAGGTRETLDIRITDETGQPRAYELFSGGEAFRVNFALRIALSQMLAERAGTRIRTLVVDEGFGTQDREGIQQLIGAIRSIQDDFDKILVITHLEELKDAFPVRIEVSKRPVVGSTFEVVGA
ncbi:MAG: SbcC/MukB-like Walker B domain-containing protein, partial [Rubricoccaceae bacterium]